MITELKLSQADYERYRDFILERIGLDFTEDKRPMLRGGLAEVMEANGCQDLDRFYLMLFTQSATGALWDQLVSALTVGETYFYRNTSHFEALRQHILPEIIAQREHSTRRIRIWSAGCSTGEEPYSVAILLREIIPNLETWNITILATDINREALTKAQAGRYGAWSFRGIEKRIQNTYFHLDGTHYVIDDRIKRMVTFAYLNLVGDRYPSLTNNTNAMDIILCRNVTIYFTAPVTIEVIKRFHQTLTDGGWLIPGSSEPNMAYYSDFEIRSFPGTVVYQKAKSPAPATARPVGQARPQVSAPFSETSTFRPQLLEPHRPNGQAAAKVIPASTLIDPFEVAQQLIQDGQLDQALVQLHKKIDLDPNCVPAYYTLGKLYANQGNLEEARAWCEKALQRDKLHAEPYYTLSLVYQEYGLLDQAVEALKRAVYLDREFILAHYNLAQIYQRQGDAASARRSLQNVLRLLDGRPRDALVPEGDGLTAGRLRELVEHALAGENG
jgi:chemotaxis protein methyltransferase CheR